MSSRATSDLWWKTAVIYCLDVETFLDWDGDGAVTSWASPTGWTTSPSSGSLCLWLMPFYPTGGIATTGTTSPTSSGSTGDSGTLGDFVEMMRIARDRGMRVIIDLVVNHTSDQHPWFKARHASRERPGGTATCGGRPSPGKRQRRVSRRGVEHLELG